MQALQDGLHRIVDELNREEGVPEGGYIDAATMFARMGGRTYESANDLFVVFERFSPPATWTDECRAVAEQVRQLIQDYHTDFVVHVDQASALDRRPDNEDRARDRLTRCLRHAADLQRRIRALNPSTRTGELSRLVAIVQIDLSAYSDMTTLITTLAKQDLSHVRCIYWLNVRILRFIHQAVRATPAGSEDNILSSSGDGALLYFDTVNHAHHFAEVLYHQTTAYNLCRANTVQFHFRVGIAYGPVILSSVVTHDQQTRQDVRGGLPLIHAARSEAAGQPDEVVITSRAFRELADDLKPLYHGPHPVTVKHAEQHEVYRRVARP